MKFIADLHLHSKYSRATSRDMEAETISLWAKRKGIKLLGTGDFTHPLYLLDLKAKLSPLGNGLLALKEDPEGTQFMLTAEVSNMFTQGGKGRRVHTLIFAPSFEVVERINSKLGKFGKISSDGRPIFGFPAKDLVKMILDISADCLLIPAHAWTPWFSIFGANSGFDSIEECFGEEAKNIRAIETGLSSDPEMNWRLTALDDITLISNSDAHSPSKIGREANIFNCELSYTEIVEAIRKKDPRKILFTIEFFPEEGKYHFDGHRNCRIIFAPKETRKNKGLCPVCGKRLTVGVMNRVEDLADRPEGAVSPKAIPALHMVPLDEIIGDALGVGTNAASVEKEYLRLVEGGRTEFDILFDLSPEELSSFTPPLILEGILRVREGRLKITPGYDGVFGKIQIFSPEERGKGPSPDEALETDQMKLF
ncbi:MAG: endonuclease Q family protein [Thermodesulfobacteriota bacterium]|nr:endonuclease Q family protein [Thermodesulfobacteriota bacterium]